MKRFKAFFQITRPWNDIIVAASVLVGVFLSGNEFQIQPVIFACLSAGLIAAGGYVFNDVFDLEIDKINKPDRILPKQKITRREALIFAWLLFFLGLFLAYLINSVCLALGFFNFVLLVLYSAYWKKNFLIGNLAVSYLGGITFIYGALSLGKIGLSFIPAILAFLFHLGREVLKDLEDKEGDRRALAKTLPVVWGEKKTVILISGIFSILILLSGLPYYFKIFNFLYLLLVIIGVDLVLFYVIWSLWQDFTIENLGRLSRILKLDMLLGLLAVVLGRIKI